MAQKLLSKKQRRLRKIFIYVSVFLTLGLIAFLLYTPIFELQGVEVRGAKHTNVAALETDVQGVISGYRYGITPNKNMFLYRKGFIKKHLLQTYPSVEEIDINMDRHRKIVITIKDRKPLGVWCDDVCYLYDTAGVVFKKSFIYTGALFVSWKKEGALPVKLLDTVDCAKLCTDVEFMDFLKAYRIEKAVMGENQLLLTSTDGYQIKTGFVASSTMGHIKNLVESKPDILREVEYVDVRFDNKIFYKEKGE